MENIYIFLFLRFLSILFEGMAGLATPNLQLLQKTAACSKTKNGTFWLAFPGNHKTFFFSSKKKYYEGDNLRNWCNLFKNFLSFQIFNLNFLLYPGGKKKHHGCPAVDKEVNQDKYDKQDNFLAVWGFLWLWEIKWQRTGACDIFWIHTQ